MEPYVIYPNREGVDLESEARNAIKQGYRTLKINWEKPLSFDQCYEFVQFLNREFPDIKARREELWSWVANSTIVRLVNVRSFRGGYLSAVGQG